MNSVMNRDGSGAEEQPASQTSEERKPHTNSAEEPSVKDLRVEDEDHKTCPRRLVMVLYGDQGQTQPLILDDNQSISAVKFQPGIADRFIVSERANIAVISGHQYANFF